MAGARLEKVGTIFARMNSLLKKNVLHPEDKPIWFEIYALHPPYTEPRYDQEGSAEEVREILYEEDLIRSKLHERVKQYDTINFADHKAETKTQKFISLYTNLKAQGALDDEKIFEIALEQLKSSSKQRVEVLEDEIHEPVDFGLIKSFTEATREAKKDAEEPKDKAPKRNDNSGSIDIKSLF
ncbi:28S ribosomal protein S23, mitochondrial [Sitodiplosis mosellana]|uniref:28S ribosomal protein S23, mitochondrial n=1 Tax=Sitodiplosis mosellana TaxID=263140 RepID=UPI0024444BC5|nr:28S ribosomal protein S23, mitochondrial [Sitodiplosis mosellana]